MEAIEQQVNYVGPQEGPQTEFLQCAADLVFYGGSAGGGKTYSLLLDPLYHLENAKFGAVIFRRTTKQIENEGGLWDEAAKLYTPIGGESNQNKLRYTFPSGMKVTFAHMEHEKNRFDWQGAQIPLILFDEITHFTWKQFIYMLSRNRSMSGVPGRIRGTCNPDPDSWVRKFIDWWIGEDGYAIPGRSGVIRWFIIQGEDVIWKNSEAGFYKEFPEKDEFGNYLVMPKSFTFIRSSVHDNKILLENDPGYLANLNALTRVEKGQLLHGNWNIRATAGTYFKRSDLEIVNAVPATAKRRVRGWDLAATKRPQSAEQKLKKSGDPDYTVGLAMSYDVDAKIFYIEQVERFREDPSGVDSKIKNIAKQDGIKTKIRIPQDPGQAGVAQAKHHVGMLAGFTVKTVPATGSKEHRAQPLSSQAQAGNVKLVKGPWNEAFLLEAENFPDGAHDDQIDAGSDAFDELVTWKRVGTW